MTLCRDAGAPRRRFATSQPSGKRRAASAERQAPSGKLSRREERVGQAVGRRLTRLKERKAFPFSIRRQEPAMMGTASPMSSLRRNLSNTMNTAPDLSRAALTDSLTRSLDSAVAELTALSADQRARPLKPSRANPDIVWTPCDHFAHLIGVERYFNRAIEKALAEQPGAAPQPQADAPTGPREEAMAAVHALNDQWILKQRDKSFDELVAMAQATRAQTLALLERAADAQLTRRLPAPWGLATVAEIFALHARHTDLHLGFIRAGLSGTA
ncbi:MAG: hypothetical protein CFK52_02150 [Chloracidobacterium sp. CP2_5A]|nr:MAG: hypothetical protein CFK52_02150 [Chloracidobacterium sp. CP2_5A]